ncbi:MAG: transcription termination/antitermination NusG family protein [Pirellulaceae bacterium]
MNAISMHVPKRDEMLWPIDLFDQEDDQQLDSRWWVVHTKSRAEKALGRQLTVQSVAHFLPLFERRRRVQRRVVQTHPPLFPGYVFMKCDDYGRRKALETNLIANCIWIEDQAAIWSDMLQICALVESGVQLAPEARLSPGKPARIISGPLQGMEGVVLKQRNAFRFVVAVHFLQQGASVEVDDCMLEPI